MFNNLWKIAIRNIIKQKFYSIINILGLAIGMACTLIVLIYVTDELSYDQFHKNVERIYRIDQTNIWGNNEEHFGSTGPAVAEGLIAEIPEFEEVTRIYTPFNDLVVSYTNEAEHTKSFNEDYLYGGDPNFFNVFSFEFLEGNPENALKEQNVVVLTKESAEKYFGKDISPIGKILQANLGTEKINLKVTGVIEDIPKTSHFNFNLLASSYSFPQFRKMEWSWIWTQVVTYVKINENTNVADITAKLPEVPKKFAGGTMERVYGYSYEDFEKKGKKWELFLLPITDIHLFSNGVNNRLGPVSDIKYVYIFSSIGLFILMLASINFMNLSTAKSSGRAREVGVRKVLGSGKRLLIYQFLIESTLLCILSLVLALGLAEIFRLPFNQVTGKQIDLGVIFNPVWLVSIIFFTIILGIISGSYPAFFLTRFKPVDVMKNKIGKEKKHSFGGLRNLLVIFQFTISITLIICTLFVYNQLQFTRNKDLGFNKENLLIISNLDKLGQNQEFYKQAILKKSRVENCAFSNATPPWIYFEDHYKAYGVEMAEIPINGLLTDEDYISTMGLELLSGRTFGKGNVSDFGKVILNETAVKELGWSIDPDSPKFAVGQILHYPGGENSTFEVSGILKNFNFQSLHNNVGALVVFHKNNPHWNQYNFGGFLSIRLDDTEISANEISETIAYAKAEWNKLSPGVPFEYRFLDDEFDTTFRSEEQLGKGFGLLTFLAIFIACLGLFGLAAFTAEQRTKEIGIRKVLGASIPNLVFLISNEFTKLIGLALLIAIPVSWWMVDGWLENFAYRITISWEVFLVAGIVSILVAWFTVSYQSIKAAIMNPTKSLRSE